MHYLIQFQQQPYEICIHFILWMRKKTLAQGHTPSKEFHFKTQDASPGSLTPEPSRGLCKLCKL